MDVGIYALAGHALSLRRGTGSVFPAIATNTDPVKFKDVEESIVWQVKFPSGVIAHCSATYRFRAAWTRFTAFAERAGSDWTPAFNYGGIHGRRSDGERIRLPGD